MKTVVDHKRRLKNGLTCAQYCLLEVMQHYTKRQGKEQIFSVKKEGYKVQKILGIDFPTFEYTLIKLKEKGFVENMIDGSSGDLTSVKLYWDDQVNDEKFQDLWNKYGKVGNKRKAREMYRRALKEVSHEYLMERTEAYLEFLKTNDHPQKHLSTFLNPTYREFDNEWKIRGVNKQKPDKEEKQVEKGNFFG